jgi:hypothetical protein
MHTIQYCWKTKEHVEKLTNHAHDTILLENERAEGPHCSALQLERGKCWGGPTAGLGLEDAGALDGSFHECRDVLEADLMKDSLGVKERETTKYKCRRCVWGEHPFK